MWQINQLSKLYGTHPDWVEIAFQTLFQQNMELKEKLILGAYLDDEINFGKAAELFETHPEELRKQFLSKGIPIKQGVQSREEILAEEASADTIFKNS